MGFLALKHVGSSWSRDQTGVPCIARQILNHWIMTEAPNCNSYDAKYTVFFFVLLVDNGKQKKIAFDFSGLFHQLIGSPSTHQAWSVRSTQAVVLDHKVKEGPGNPAMVGGRGAHACIVGCWRPFPIIGLPLKQTSCAACSPSFSLETCCG